MEFMMLLKVHHRVVWKYFMLVHALFTTIYETARKEERDK